MVHLKKDKHGITWDDSKNLDHIEVISNFYTSKNINRERNEKGLQSCEERIVWNYHLNMNYLLVVVMIQNAVETDIYIMTYILVVKIDEVV